MNGDAEFILPGGLAVADRPDGDRALAREALLRRAEREVRHFWWITFGIGIPVALSLLAGIFALLFDGPRALGVGGITAAVLLYGVMLWFLRPYFPGRTVLWIRRFHQGKRSRNLRVLMEFATGPSGSFITLSDEDVVSQSGDGAADKAWYAAVIGVFVVMLLTSGGQPLALGIAVGAAVGGCWYGVHRVLRARRRARKIRPRNMEKKIDKALRATRRRTVSDPVIQCPEQGELWFHAITYLARHVDAVVIFADETSPGLGKELRLLLGAGRLGAGKVVVLRSGPCSGLVEQHPALADAWHFQLPDRLSNWWPYTRAGRELSRVIHAAVLSPPAVAHSRPVVRA